MVEEKLVNLKAILGDHVRKDRLVDILEASDGSLEHAISIYFDQKNQQKEDVQHVKSNITNTAEDGSIKNKSESSKKRKPHIEGKVTTKQSRLDTFFRVNTSTNIGSSSSFPARNTSQIDREEVGAVNDDVERCRPDSNLPIKNNISVSAIDAIIAPIDENNTNPVSFVSFARLADTLQEMTDTTKRLVKLKALETLIGEIINTKNTVTIDTDRGVNDVSTRAHTLASALELVLGGCTLIPLNVSGSAVSKALQTSLGITRNQISSAYRKYGDLGDCAASFFQKKTYFTISSNTCRPLSILQVAEGLRKISETEGRVSKQHVLFSLLRGCQSKSECRFLVRLLIRNMRIGANIKTVLAALAMVIISIGKSECVCKSPCNNTGNKCIKEKKSCPSSGTPPLMDTKDAIVLVQKTYDVCPNIKKIAHALLEGGFDQMQRECSIQVMTQISPMLAHPVHSLKEINDKMGDYDDHILMEWKYDGMRCQAHYDGVYIKLFSRNMLDITNQFVDVSKFLLEAMQTNKNDCTNSSFIIDVEIVGVEGEGRQARLLPFQDLSTRKKKMDDGSGVRVKIFAFDLMFLNGKSFVDKPFFCRRLELHKLFKETSDFSFVSSQRLISYDESKIKSFLTEAVEGGAEGLMLKLLGQKTVMAKKLPEGVQLASSYSTYEAGTRSHCWLKVKRDYIVGFADTIDVVPIGAWWGSGRKAQKSFLSPILLAVYDDEEDVFRSISRCMSFTDAMYESIREFYFRGIPYPISLNAVDNPQHNLSTVDLIGNDDDDDDDDDDHHISERIKNKEENDQTSQDEAVMKEENDNNNDRVNCFPNRPTSAFVITNEMPTIWFQPMEVFEVAFADLSLSRQHTAAAGLVDEEGRGVALRFPRFKRRRPDKKPEQATTSIEIAQLFAKQSKIKNRPRLKDI